MCFRRVTKVPVTVHIASTGLVEKIRFAFSLFPFLLFLYSVHSWLFFLGMIFIAMLNNLYGVYYDSRLPVNSVLLLPFLFTFDFFWWSLIFSCVIYWLHVITVLKCRHSTSVNVQYASMCAFERRVSWSVCTYENSVYIYIIM